MVEYRCGIATQVELHSSLRAKARHGARRPFLELLTGTDFWHEAGCWAEKLRRADHDAGWYDEVVTDPETGAVIHEEHHPLSEHRGHGSDKRPEMMTRKTATRATKMGPWSNQWNRVQLGLARVEAVYEGRPEPEGTAGAEYDVFAFFVNCRHLMDWIESDADLDVAVSGAARAYARATDVLMVCEDLANRSKHSALTRPTRTGDPTTGPSSNDVNIMLGRGEARHAFRVSSTGTERDALDLAHTCVDAWSTFLRHHNLT